MERQIPRSAHTAVALLLTTLLPACAGRRGPEVPVGPPVASSPTFAFEALDTPAARALTAALEAALALPTSQESYDERVRAVAAAREALRGSAREAVALLEAELDGRPETDRPAWDLALLLLAETGSESAADVLAALSLRPLPAATDPPNETGSCGSSRRQEASGIRRRAVVELGRMAADDWAPARNRLLDLVARGDDDVSAAAVEAYYRVRSERWRAKRELLERLPRERRHLVHSIF